MRFLDARKIAYTASTYDATGEFHSATEAADLLQVPANSVYKTLVILRDAANKGKPLLIMVPSAEEVDLRLLAKSMGEKKLRMATLREAESLTGLQVGGISALALLNRGFQIYIDRKASMLERIHVSAGARGIDLELAVSDLVSVTRAKMVEATRGA